MARPAVVVVEVEMTLTCHAERKGEVVLVFSQCKIQRSFVIKSVYYFVTYSKWLRIYIEMVCDEAEPWKKKEAI